VPFAFFNMLSPLFSILFAYLNYKIRRYDDDEPGQEKVITDEDRRDI
jgi:NhaC family Na+:H+ antiporter